ncbi:MAG: hypothetical protein CVU77_07395 [Elusimicrobia bacterium HGW-Elusimicrobia-1]|jgi:hypothetical protein|nr:MAG: hypothetical protein CVU77_07395 [Elusimicrobia bacterium HGW-Elusimicrobia-1]
MGTTKLPQNPPSSLENFKVGTGVGGSGTTANAGDKYSHYQPPALPVPEPYYPPPAPSNYDFDTSAPTPRGKVAPKK